MNQAAIMRGALTAALPLLTVVFAMHASAQPATPPHDEGVVPADVADEADAGGPEAAARPIEDASAPPPARDADASPPPGPATEQPEDGAPIGRAAPPTESATHGTGPVRTGLEIFAQYNYKTFFGPKNNRAWFHSFDVPRVHGAIEGQWEDVRGRLVLEATRSASDGSLVGVSGDSLVLRVREAYAAYRIAAPVEVSAGVVPTLTVPNLDGTWMLRVVAPSGLEANGLMSPADLGAKVRFDEPHGYGWVAVAAYNGDGYTSRELNRGKSVEGALELHPLPKGNLRPLGIFVSYVDGSTGTSFARANRLTSGLVWQGARLRAGAFATYAWGIAQLGTQRGMVATAFLRAEPIHRVLLGARLDHVVRDVGGEPNDIVTTLWGAAGYRIALPIEAFFAVSRSVPTTRAQSELPGSDAWELRTMARVVF